MNADYLVLSIERFRKRVSMVKGKCRNQEESARIRFARDVLKDPVEEVLRSE